MCFDVLEHIPNSSGFFLVMDSRLQRNGLPLENPVVLHGSHIEHLPEAEENWHQQVVRSGWRNTTS